MKYTVSSVIPFRKKWRAEFRKSGTRPKGSARIRKVINAASEEEAREAAEALAHKMSVENEDDMTELVEEFLGTLERLNLAASTKEGYRIAAKRSLNYFLDHRTSADEFAFRGGSEEYVRQREGSGASANSVRHEISILRMAMREKYAADPFEGVRIPRRCPRTLNETDGERLTALLRAVEGEVGTIAWLAFGCSLYPSEIAALRYEDVPMDEDKVRVENTVGPDGVLRKSLRPRTVELSGDALRRVRTYELGRSDRYGYLFGGRDAPPNPNVLSRKWASVARAHGLRATLSDLRIEGRRSKCI